MLASSKTLKMKKNDQGREVYPTFHNEVICKDLLESTAREARKF